MTGGRRNTSYQNLEDDAQVANTRRGQGERSIVTTGYVPGGPAEAAKPIPGDQKFPFFKDVSDVGPTIRLFEPAKFTGLVVDNPIPGPVDGDTDLDTFAVSQEIDVRGIATIITVQQYFPEDVAAAGSRLIILPQFQIALPESPGANPTSLWVPVGVVDPMQTASNAPVDLCFTQRPASATEIIRDAAGLQTTTGDGPSTFGLVWDVQGYNTWRFLIADQFSDAAGLNMFYMTQR